MNLEEVLEHCLADLEEERATGEECLARYPEFREELAPLLALAVELRAAPDVVLPISAKEAIRERVTHLPLPRQVQPVVMPRLAVRPAYALVTSILALLLFGGGLALASAESLPGEPLYPVKRTLEQMALALLPGQEPTLRLDFAERRLQEAEALLQRGQIAAAQAVLGEYREELEAAFWLIAYELGRTGERPPLIYEAQEHLAQESTRLAELRARVPSEALGVVDQALSIVEEFSLITSEILENPPIPPTDAIPTPTSISEIIPPDILATPETPGP